MNNLIIDAATNKIFLVLITGKNIYTCSHENSKSNFERLIILITDFLNKNKNSIQKIDKIYVNGYVYQDRPLYLLIGFIIYKILSLFNPIFQIENISLLLLTSLIIQILVVNFIAFLITKLVSNKFERFYFILFFLLTLFSFEERFYFFLPSNSTIYFLIFLLARF